MILMASIIYVIVRNFLRFSASLCKLFVFLRFSAYLVYSYGLVSAKTGPISFLLTFCGKFTKNSSAKKLKIFSNFWNFLV